MKKNNNLKEVRKKLMGDFTSCHRFKRFVILLLQLAEALLQISIPWILQSTINAITVEMSVKIFVRAITLAVIIIFSMIFISYIKTRIQNTYMFCFNAYMKDKLFAKMMSKSVVEFKNNNSGEYLSVYQTDVQKITDLYINGKWGIVSSLTLCVLGIISMIKMSPKLALIILIVQIIPISITLMLGIKLPVYHEEFSAKRGAFSAATQDYLKGFRLIKAFATEKVFINKFSYNNKVVELSGKRVLDKAIGINLINYVANYILIIAMFFIGGLEVLNGKMQVGTIIACFELFQTISQPFTELAMQYNNVRTADGTFERINKLFYSDTIDLQEDIKKNKNLLNEITSIRLNDVSFFYNKEKVTLDNVSYEFINGRKYAIVGDSGSGKTTLMNLLLGYYPNYKGNITINDHELNDYSSEQINKKISIVQQDVFIFDDSLKANLTLGREFTDEQLNSAIQRAGLSEFVYKNGLDYICGEDGNNLSGGEKQRISIARTLLRDSGVIFFDEVTSSLDNCTTIAIEETIKSLDKTCIAITHKLNLNVLRNYDEVLVFKEGKLVESGTVDELIENNQYFYSLYTFSK